MKENGKGMQTIYQKASDTFFTFWDTLWEQFYLSNKNALIDASLGGNPLLNLRKSSSTRPENQPSKPPREQTGLTIYRDLNSSGASPKSIFPSGVQIVLQIPPSNIGARKGG